MRNLLPLVLILGSLSAQAQNRYKDIDLINPEYAALSVLYSRTRAKAVVLILDKRHEVAFLSDCEAPFGEGHAVLLTSFFHCEAIDGSFFVFNSDNAATVNRNFPEIVERKFTDLQRRRNESDQFKATHQYFPLTVLASPLSAWISWGYARSALIYWQIPDELGVFTKGAGSLLFGVGAVVAAYESYKMKYQWNEMPVRALEDDMRQRLKELTEMTSVSKRTPPYVMDFQDGDFALTYELLRSSLIESIERLNRA